MRDSRDINAIVGFNPQERDLCVLAHNIIRPYLPHSLSKLDYDKTMRLIERKVAQDKIQGLAFRAA